MKTISAKLIADSLCPKGHRLTSLIVTMPRFILAEFNTHRLFSRNSASSRAIPFERMLKMVQENPFIPIAWQKDHKGMQGTEYFKTKEQLKVITDYWEQSRQYAMNAASMLNYAGVSKQLCNRLLEPFMWHTVIVSATEWLNFFEQRCPQYNYLFEFYKSKKEVINNSKDNLYNDGRKLSTFTNLDWLDINKGQAEIHMMATAEAIYDAINESTPKQLQEGEWHIPFGDNIDEERLGVIVGYNNISNNGLALSCTQAKIRVAVARCARVSYLNYEGKDDYLDDLRLYDFLIKNLHLSPLEHCARAMTEEEYYSFSKGKNNICDEDENNIYINTSKQNNGFGWCANFKGWISQRYITENDYN